MVWEKPCKDKSNVLLKTIIQNAIWDIHNLNNVISWCQHVIFILLMTPLAFTQPFDLNTGYCWKEKSASLSCYTTLLLQQLSKTRELISMDHFAGGQVARMERKKRDQAIFSYMISNTHLNASWRHTKVWAPFPANSCISLKQPWNHSLRKPHHEELQTECWYHHITGNFWVWCQFPT